MIRSLSLFLMLISTAAFADLSEGQPAPNLLGKDVKGNPVTVDAFRGKVLVVTFWASWCGPCRKELPALNALQNAVGTELIQVVAINSKEDPKTINGIMRQMKDRQIISSQDRTGAIGDTYDVQAFPNLWIINPSGNIVFHKVGYGEDSLKGIAQKIIEVLHEYNPGALNRPAGES